MKKRILILVSTIICAMATVALVAITLVGAFKTGSTTPGGVDESTTNIGVEGGNLTNENSEVYLIVGDEFSDGFMTSENYTGTLLSAKNETTFVAEVAGTEQLSIQTETVVRSYTITVFEEGDGSEANPYNIISPEDLIQLTSDNSGLYAYYKLQRDLDLSAYESWAPIGKLTDPFLGSFDGNGYQIKNLNIVVTPENLSNYLDNALTQGGSNGTMLTVGFFGFVGDVAAVQTSYIKNLDVVDAKIDTTAIETEQVRPTIQITQSYVGTLAGYTAYTDIIGSENNNQVSVELNSAISADKTTTLYTAVAGMVGGAYYSNIENYSVNTVISSKNPGVIKDNGSGYNYYGTVYAGALGYNFNTNVQNLNVNLTAEVKNYEGTVVAGAIGYIESGKNAKVITIKDVTVDNLFVRLNRYSNFDTYAGVVAGAINCNYNTLTTMENIRVTNAVVNAIGTGQVVGLINTNHGTIINPYVSGSFNGTIVAGIVYENRGTITYDANMQDLYVIEVDLKGQTQVAGMAIYNYGLIQGSEQLSTIKASLRWSIVNKYFDECSNDFVMAGISAYNHGTIENIHTVTNIYDAVNAAGAVGELTGTIKNLNINTTIRTIAGRVGVTNYSGKSNCIGGVAIWAKGASVEVIDVNANVTVNNTNTINTENLYGLNVFGSIVAVVDGEVDIYSAKEQENIVQVTLFTNYSQNETQQIGKVAGTESENSVISMEKTSVVLAIIKTADGANVEK